MIERNEIVIPGPDSFGFRVNARTPLAHVVGVLRRANPRASYNSLRAAAEALRSGQQMTREPRPDRFDSGTAGVVDNSPAAVPSSAAESSPTPAAVADPATLDEIENGKVARAAVAAWAKAQTPALDVPAKGFLPGAVVAAYRAAMRDEYLASLTPVVNADGTPAEPMPADVPPSEVH